MTSTDNISSFKLKLKELTKEDNPLLKGGFLVMFSFNFSSKPFYGYIFDSTFKITKNSNFYFIPYIFAGEFKKNGNFTEVKYQIVPMKFGYYWIRIFPLLINLIGITFLLINVNISDLKNINFFKVILIISFIELFLFSAVLITELFKKRFENKFLKELNLKS